MLKTNRACTALFAATLVVATAACGGGSSSDKAAEKIIENATGGSVQVDKNGEKIKIETKEGTFESSTGSSAKVPNGFPSSIPLPKNLKLASAATLGKVFTLGYTGGAADIKKACEEVRAGFKAAGFSEELYAETGGSIVGGVTKGNVSANWTCNPSSGELGYVVDVQG
jgi:hypothetical protein